MIDYSDDDPEDEDLDADDDVDLAATDDVAGDDLTEYKADLQNIGDDDDDEDDDALEDGIEGQLSEFSDDDEDDEDEDDELYRRFQLLFKKKNFRRNILLYLFN